MREFRKFFNEHPFLGTAFLVAGAFTLYETISAVKAPKGEGPFSQMGGVLGASTSTTSSTSSSHAMMDRPLTDDVMPVRSVGHSDFFGINPHVVGASNLGSANLPPAMRRRISQRQRGTGSLGNWGNVAIDLEDNIAMSHYNAVGDLYGLGGMTPEAGTGWTE
tara:strand:+ start:1054 stop:1542 length:489 start_codon:yes stop_codon:yes gene_type:complete